MDLAYRLGLMGRLIMVSIKMEREVGMGYMRQATVRNMKGVGLMGRNTGKERSVRMVRVGEESGRTGRK